MAAVSLENWKEQIRDPKIECMSRDEMTALQSERLIKQVENVYEHVSSKESRTLISFHLQQKKI